MSSHNALTHPERRTFRRLICSNEKITVAFAYYPLNPSDPHFVVSEPLTHYTVRWAKPPYADHVFYHRHLLVSSLRYASTIAAFNFYPESRRDLQINRLLWQTAQNGEYSPARGNLLLQNNVLSISIPSKFYAFLADVTYSQLHLCMLEILSLIAEEEDQEGLDLIQSELHPSVWADLVLYMAQQHHHRHRQLQACTSAGVTLSDYVQMLLKLCYHSPWKIEMYTAYLTPRTINSALFASSTTSPEEALIHISSLRRKHDTNLVRSTAKRPVSTSNHRNPFRPPRLPSSFFNRNSVFWKLFRDWRRYRWMLVQLLGIHPRDAAAAMLRSVTRGTQYRAWERVDAIKAVLLDPILTLSNHPALPALPEDVISTKIAPFVLLNESNG